MNSKRIILTGLWVIVIFTVSCSLLQGIESSSEDVITRFFMMFDFSSIGFWGIITMFVLSLGTSLFIWIHRTGNADEKARHLWYLCASISSLISLLLILVVVRRYVKVFPLGDLFFMLTGLFIGTAFHLLTQQTKIMALEIIKVIIIGALVFVTVLFACTFASTAHDIGDTWEYMLFISLFCAAVAAIASLIINMNIVLGHLRKTKVKLQIDCK